MSVPAVRVADLTEAKARDSVRRVNAKLEEAAEELVWQIENEVWHVLGYESWDEMREAEYGGAVLIVPRADRPELVSRLRSAGLVQKQIADTLGVAQRTVSGDLLNSSFANQPATITNARGQQRPTSYAPRITETATTTTVIDGITGEVLTPVRDREAEHRRALHDNAVQYSQALARSLTHLADIHDNPSRIADRIAWWAESAGEVSPAQAENVTPANIRRIAAGLIQLAKAWEAQK